MPKEFIASLIVFGVFLLIWTQMIRYRAHWSTFLIVGAITCTIIDGLTLPSTMSVPIVEVFIVLAVVGLLLFRTIPRMESPGWMKSFMTLVVFFVGAGLIIMVLDPGLLHV